MHNRTDTKHKTNPTVSVDLMSAIITGCVMNVVLNPLDKAIFHSMHHHNRRFFSKDNFSNPYQGATLSTIQRVLSSGVYYGIQGLFRSDLAPAMREMGIRDTTIYITTGFFAGTFTGLLFNAFSISKAQMWQQKTSETIQVMQALYRNRGLSAFKIGITANVARDSIHGSTYELIRHTLRHQAHKFHQQEHNSPHVNYICDAAASFGATALIGPLTYVRNIQYGGALQNNVPTVQDIIANSWQLAKQAKKTSLGRAAFLLGLFRVDASVGKTALSMAGGQWLFDKLRTKLST